MWVGFAENLGDGVEILVVGGACFDPCPVLLKLLVGFGAVEWFEAVEDILVAVDDGAEPCCAGASGAEDCAEGRLVWGVGHVHLWGRWRGRNGNEETKIVSA